MRVVLADPLWYGHHPTYLKFMTMALDELGHDVVLFCRNPVRMRELLSVVPQLDGANVEVREYVWPQDTLQVYTRRSVRHLSLQRLSHLSSMIRAHESVGGRSVDLLFFPYLDPFMQRYQTARDWDSRLKRPFSGVYFYPTHLRSPPRFMPLRRFCFEPENILRSRYCNAVATLDEGITEQLSKRLLHKRIIAWPDITDATAPADTSLGAEIIRRASGRKVVGLLGSLEPRKGLFEFIETMRLLPEDRFFFVIAGLPLLGDFDLIESNRWAQFIKHPPGNCLLHQAYISDEAEFNRLFCACDVLCAVYRNFCHSSNVLTKAAVFAVPVVVAKGYLMQERVDAFGLGRCVQEGSVQDLVAALQDESLLNLKKHPEFVENCRHYAAEHSQSALVECFRKLLGSYGNTMNGNSSNLQNHRIGTT